MVDSQIERAMADRIDDLTGRVQTLEKKLDLLSASVDQKFEQMGRRFDAVDEALLEQRQYTEFAFSSLEARMGAGDARLDAKMDNGFTKMDAGFTRVGERFDRLERKLDQFIDLHL